MRARGFTLVEVLLAIALIAVIAGGATGLALGLVSRRELIDRVGARDRGISILMDQIERDALAAFAGAPDAAARGFDGGPSSLSIASRARGWSGAGPSTLDVVESRYRFDAGGDGDGPPGRVLATRGRGAPEETLARGVALLRLRYHDGVAWTDRFASGADGRGLPWAIEVAVWFGDPAEFGGGAGASADAGEASADAGDAAASRDEAASGGEDGASEPRGIITRPPDRLRVIMVPDAGVSAAGPLARAARDGHDARRAVGGSGGGDA
jgi:prepilin-type N-terminal cleavage/methylation domain-containing protein